MCVAVVFDDGENPLLDIYEGSNWRILHVVLCASEIPEALDEALLTDVVVNFSVLAFL